MVNFQNFKLDFEKEGELDIRLSTFQETLEDGGGIGWGDHFLFYKSIKRTFEHCMNSTKQLNAGRGRQSPRKATHCL